jgi:helix-turn-helix protein
MRALKVKPLTTMHRSTRTLLEVDQADRETLAEELSPLILKSIEQAGVKLSDREVAQIKERIRDGARLEIGELGGPAAKVSGNVAGSVTVDW